MQGRGGVSVLQAFYTFNPHVKSTSCLVYREEVKPVRTMTLQPILTHRDSRPTMARPRDMMW